MQPTRSQPPRQCQNRQPISGQTTGNTNGSGQDTSVAANNGTEMTATEPTQQSIGTYRPSGAKLAELESLPELFKDVFDQATQTAYENILFSLIKNGARHVEVRKKGYKHLRRLLTQHVDAVPAHNNFAQNYNADFEGKHERFHLPVFPDLVQASIPGPDAPVLDNHGSLVPQQPQQPLTGNEVHQPLAGNEVHQNPIPTNINMGLGANQGVNPTAPRQVRPVAQWKSTPAQAAQAYIAWLRYRRSSFPTVAPFLADAKVLATHLMRPVAAVYDDITHHYLLETDSVRGQWYRENRLQVLGEDPQI